MLTFSLIPSRIIALINDVRVVPDVTLKSCGRNVVLGGSRADDDNSSSIWRPLISFNSILKICEWHRLAAATDREKINLCLRFLCGRSIQIARRDHRECFSVGTPSRHARAESFRTQSPRCFRTFDRKRPYCRFAPILLLIDGRYNVSDYFSVRRQVRIAYELK